MAGVVTAVFTVSTLPAVSSAIVPVPVSDDPALRFTVPPFRWSVVPVATLSVPVLFNTPWTVNVPAVT